MINKELAIMNMESYIQGIKHTFDAVKSCVDFSIAEMEKKINELKEIKE